MIELAEIELGLDAGLPERADLLHQAAAKALGIGPSELREVRWIRRSVDARKKASVHFVATLGVLLRDESQENWLIDRAQKRGYVVKRHAKYCSSQPAALEADAFLAAFGRPVVIGAGPAGLFCALRLARAGMRPILLERGDSVEKRTAAIRSFNEGGPLDLASNIQFGEGGAGTFSDGKLTTNIKSPYKQEVLHLFAQAGAPEDILWQAKPHIGTDVLVAVVRALRQQIEAAGGTVLFRTQMVDFRTSSAGLTGVVLQTQDAAAVLACADGAVLERASELAECVGAGAAAAEEDRVLLPARQVVLACGHSARDTFSLLYEKGLELEQKPFSAGVRIEHSQAAIDAAQYGASAGHPALGPADYKLAAKTKSGRGVYTFCMCPGGEVVAAASEEGGVCTNGMSRHARAGKNANAALLVGIEPSDLGSDHPLAGVELQRNMEQAAYELAVANGGASYAAPAQRVASFLHVTPTSAQIQDASERLQPSYPRGVAWCDLHECLPAFIAEALEEALVLFARRIEGFAAEDAILTGVEARSSSPVRLVRERETLQATRLPGFFPCGEGAGYAGGIMSAACDGLRVAQAIIDEAKGWTHG